MRLLLFPPSQTTRSHSPFPSINPFVTIRKSSTLWHNLSGKIYSILKARSPLQPSLLQKTSPRMKRRCDRQAWGDSEAWDVGAIALVGTIALFGDVSACGDESAIAFFLSVIAGEGLRIAPTHSRSHFRDSKIRQSHLSVQS